jgi:hypothetical protein
MRRTDAAAFVATAFSVLVVNAVAAVGIGWSCYLLPVIWQRFRSTTGGAALASDTLAVE